MEPPPGKAPSIATFPSKGCCSVEAVAEEASDISAYGLLPSVKSADPNGKPAASIDGVCHSAAVGLVAVSCCPVVGGDAEAMATSALVV